MSERTQVAIVGGGIVGSALALQLVRHARLEPADLLLFERDAPVAPAADAPLDLRMFALSPASIALLREAGAWQRLDPARIGCMERMQVWPGQWPADSPRSLRFDAAESGDEALGAIVEARAAQAALLACCAAEGIRVVSDAVERITAAPAPQLHAGGRIHEPALLVGADGARSGVREAAGITVHERGYGQTAIVANVRAGRAVARTAFQRFLETGPLAFLPLPGDLYSIVWSARDARASELMALDDAGFAAELAAASAQVLGELELASRRASFPLRRLQARQYVAEACVLVGDAAHVIHPLAGQGVNQGLGDAVALARALGSRPRGESVAARRALRRYERERRADNALMGAVVDSLDLLFSRGAPLRQLAGHGMALVGALPAARRLLTRAAAGRSSPRR